MRECVGGLQADPITEDAQKVWLRDWQSPGVRDPGAYKGGSVIRVCTEAP